MTYIYDTVLEINQVTLERYGVTYKLEQTFKMGKRKFASFIYPGMDKLLIVPQFAEQYHQLDGKLKRLSKNKSFEDWVKYIESKITEETTTDEEPDPDDDSKMIQTCSFQYKDIRVKLLYEEGKAWLSSEFEVVQNNLFGNGFIVDLKADEDE